jgi:hypothetical protein
MQEAVAVKSRLAQVYGIRREKVYQYLLQATSV